MRKKNAGRELPMMDIEIKTWAEQNFLFSIVQNMETGWDWLMNNFIQLRASHYVNSTWNVVDTNLTFYPYSMHNLQPGMIDLCPYVNKYMVPKAFVTNNYRRFSDFIQCAIEGGYYICTYLDQYFRTTMKGQTGFHHPNYIYGYNNRSKKIYLVDNFEKGKYGKRCISYDQVNRAYSLVEGDSWLVSIFLYELFPYHHKFSTSYVVDQLNDYLKPGRGICYLDRTVCPEHLYYGKDYYNDIYFGIDCYSLLGKYLDGIIREDELFRDNDWRIFSMLCDHKHVMIQRYHYMLSEGYIFYSSELVSGLEELERLSVNLLNIFLKYTLSGNKKYLKKTIDYLNEIKDKDIKTITCFLDSIVEKKG